MAETVCDDRPLTLDDLTARGLLTVESARFGLPDMAGT